MLALSSCASIPVINKSSELYLAGPAIRDYQPEGLVEEVQYECSVTGPTHRRMIVYLPKDYYTSGERYPVLYLLHGARGYETSWIRFGEVYKSTDSLWREEKAEHCIIVMPNINQYNDDEDYAGGRAKNAFESIWEVDGKAEWSFVHDVVMLTDSLYRTIPDKDHRAIAGLSIGGYQSVGFGANHPDIFGYVGALSPYFWASGQKHAYNKAFYGGLKQKIKNEFGSEPPSGYYLYAGKWDLTRPSTLRFHKWLNRKGYSHSYTKYPGSHDWPDGWTQEFKDMFQKLFK